VYVLKNRQTFIKREIIFQRKKQVRKIEIGKVETAGYLSDILGLGG